MTPDGPDVDGRVAPMGPRVAAEGGGHIDGRARPRIPWLDALGVAATDSEDLRVAKSTLTRTALLIVVLAAGWVGTYLVLGRTGSAMIPLAYQVTTLASLAIFARTKSFHFLRSTQLSMWLVLPFALQWSLGGFARSSGVALWAALTPSVSRFFGSRALPWLGGFLALLGASIALEGPRAAAVAPLPTGVVSVFFGLNIGAVTLVVLAAVVHFVRERDRHRAALEAERSRSDALLLNVLPPPIARRLQDGEWPIADRVGHASVLFADIVGFTPRSRSVEPGEMVRMLGDLFAEFDDLADGNGLVGIKTLGDGYMAVGGLFDPSLDPVSGALETAMALRDVTARRVVAGAPLVVRVGVGLGPVVAAVVGRRKFSYDVWGDAVNLASRMESHGIPGAIQVTAAIAGAADHRYRFSSRGTIDVKGVGSIETFLLEGRRAP
jgi:adenylate cyclase